MTQECAGFIWVSLERDESDSTALSVTTVLAACATALPSPRLIRLLRRLVVAADHKWNRLPEGRPEAPYRSQMAPVMVNILRPLV